MASGFVPLIPAVPAFRPDGTLYSPAFDDVYASDQGTLEQASHVFIRGNDLARRWASADRFTIVETGFGTGLNFLASWEAWRAAAGGAARLDYVSVEKHPFPAADLAAVLARYAELKWFAEALQRRYPLSLPGFHRLHFDHGRISLTLLFGDAVEMLGKLEARADAFYLDGFAPAKNPQMWSAELFRQLARLAAPGATFATYTVAGAVRRGLAEAGFEVRRGEGFGSKREMLAGRYRGTWEPRVRHDRRAVVIGAGLAGTACAHRLADRGWEVTLLDRRSGLAMEASGNPAGLLRPVFSLDWNLHSRVTVASYFYVLRHLDALAESGFPVVMGEGGVLQLARDTENFAKQRRIVERFSLPEELVRLVDTAQAGALAGMPVGGPGWWFPGAVWASPASICKANISAGGARVNVRTAADVAMLRRGGEGWALCDSAGQVIAEAPTVILANARSATGFEQAQWLPLRDVRGQISFLPQIAGLSPQLAIAREGYITPAFDGRHCLGASFNEGVDDPSERVEDHESNLRRLDAMLPGVGSRFDAAALHGRVAFRAMATDRLPILGALPSIDDAQGNSEGLYCCLALGSRGMTWGALAAEVVASRIDGDPMPLEAELLRALDPRRFLVRNRLAAKN